MNPFLFFPWLGFACIFLLAGLIQFARILPALSNGDFPTVVMLGITAIISSIVGLILALTLLKAIR